MSQRWRILTGLAVGGAFGLLKLNITASAYINLLCASNDKDIVVKKSSLRYIFSQAATVLLLAAIIKYNIWVFAGAVAGILLVPAVIMINSLTENLGISHNNFE